MAGKKLERQRKKLPPLSDRMTFLRLRDIRLGAGAALLLLGLSAALSFFMLDGLARQMYEEEQENAAVFDSSEPAGYSYIKLQYLTGSFAEHVKNEDNYYFGFDYRFTPYLISIRGGLTEELQQLIDYTYGDGSGDAPEAVNVYGYGVPIESELLGYARDSYSAMWEETRLPVTMEELSGIVGSYYLDTVPRTYLQQHPLALLFYVIPAAMLAAGALFTASYGKRIRAQKRRLSGFYEDLDAADREFASAAEYVKGSRIYLTPHFIISASYQFEIIPYRRIRRLEHSGGLLIAVTEDGYAHIVAGGRCRRYALELKREIERRISENTAAEGEHDAVISGN